MTIPAPAAAMALDRFRLLLAGAAAFAVSFVTFTGLLLTASAP